MANTIFFTFQSNELLLCLLFLINSLETVQVTNAQQTQDHFLSHFIARSRVCSSFGKNKNKIIVCVHIFSWNTLS